ncbi:MAG: cell wall-binding repeat-containing protein [Gracilibacteraceae bacterium]|jgi:hypothetical protein|nr:cell wall-binding repeat-containing protein [Gracilibacteraceae bacterium]
MRKKFFAVLFTAAMLATMLPGIPAFTAEPPTVTVQNDYIKATVSTENGGYTISTLEGDILKKSDDNKALTHRGENFDTSFTSFKVGNKEYVFGNDYGLLGLGSTPVTTETDSVGVTSTWRVDGFDFVQRIELVNGVASEQLGTAAISYTVKNNTQAAASVQSRVLIDTQLGENDFGYYEVTKGVLGAGYDFIDTETTLEGAAVPADYFVKDAPFQPQVAAFGVNSVMATDKPYKMTFAHWANIAATRFDYSADPSLTFSNELNPLRTADSAAALYYDLGALDPGGERSFSTFYGVTANLKNKDNQVLVNTTAPAKLDFNDQRTAFIGSSGQADNLVRVNTTVTNPLAQGKRYANLAVVVYAIGFSTERQSDDGNWIAYNNIDPLYTNIANFAPGGNITTFFDFKFEPRDNHELGSFVTRVYDMDPGVNELGVYADDYCLGETVNYIFIPAKDPTLPSITLSGMEPSILYNAERRYLTLSGIGMSFFKTGLAAIELRGPKKTYSVPLENLTIAQDARSISLLLEEYMEPGQYQLFFLWDGSQPADVPELLTSSALMVQLTENERYRSDQYGLLAVLRNGNNTYRVLAYNDEASFTENKGKSATSPLGYDEDDLLLTIRGSLLKDGDEYRLAGKEKDVNINHILNYRGSDFTVSATGGSVEVLMDGKLTTVGANTTVRNGSAAFKLEKGTNYIVPVYDDRGVILSGESLERADDSYIELKWNNAVDKLQTIGGFLIDLKYGVLGKIEEGGGTYDIISFGGGLDLSFMTPGGASAARKEKDEAAGSTWTTETGTVGGTEIAGSEDSSSSDFGFGATVYDVLYGQNSNKTGHLGINMDASVQLPQIVSFLPAKIGGTLAINTIGGYQVGVEGNVETSVFAMSFALVVKSNPSGVPIPDKLFFSLGGFEPGINVDGMGIFWVTGGGGGFDNLYETIYGTDGIPPFKVLLNIQFDIVKIMTGAADFELSLRGFAISLSEVTLKMLENAKFLDGGLVKVMWYPEFGLDLQANVNFFEVFKGNFYLTASKDLFEMMLRVALMLPDDLPVVGGMELAAAELGGGTEKLWGEVSFLDVGIGFVFWWDTGDLEFKSGDMSGLAPDRMNRFASGKMRGFASSFSLAPGTFMAMTSPQVIDTDPETGEIRYAAIGSNLQFVAGSAVDRSLTSEQVEAGKTRLAPRMRTYMAAATTVTATADMTQHRVTFGEPSGDYILTLSRVDGEPLDPDFPNLVKMWNNGQVYPLNFYEAPGIVGGLATGEELTAEQKTQIENAAKANANIVGDIAYIVIPRSAQSLDNVFILEFTDGEPYSVGAVFVQPIARLTSQTAALSDHTLSLTWQGDYLNTATVSVSISDEPGSDGILIAEGLPASAMAADVTIPATVASGAYTVTLTLIDEDTCYKRYPVGGDNPTTVTITDAQAPAAPQSVTLSNAGNDKLKVAITDDFSQAKLEGYYVDVYEDGSLVEAAVYYAKAQAQGGQILIGGRYDLPVLEEYTEGGVTKYRQTVVNGEEQYRTVGFTPGKSYSVKVRAGASVDPDPSLSGDEVYHFSGYVKSAPVTLAGATPPVLTLTGAGLSGHAANAVGFSADVPVSGTLTVNGADGESYTFSAVSTWAQPLALADGVYTLEFRAVDGQGDISLIQTTLEVDTAAPVLMLDSPLSGGIFTGNMVTLRGIADRDARYTIMVDGESATQNADLSAYFANGILEYDLALGDGASRHAIEILARDAAGNETERMIEVVSADLAGIERVEIRHNDQPVGARITLPNVGDTADLRLMGITGTGAALDITGLENAALTVASGTSAILTDGKVTAVSEGVSMILGSFDLGGGFALHDAAPIAVGGDGDSGTGDGRAPTPSGGSGLSAAKDPATGAQVTVTRESLSYISGANRVLTSVAISRQGWTSADTVILAPGGQNNLIDALAVAPLAGQENAPILLCVGGLDPAVVAEIQRLGAKRVYAVGALSETVIEALKAALPNVAVEVLRGANRFETAALINAQVQNPKGTFIVGYNAIADAVSAASFAAANGYLIQIAQPDGTLATAHYPLPTDHYIYILGGPALVGDVAGATRLYGPDRYATNKAIREALPFEYTNIYTANGATLVDALTGSALAARTKAAIVLTPAGDPTGVDFGGITPETRVYAFGGGK